MSKIESKEITLKQVECIYPYFEKNIDNRYGATFLINKRDVINKREIVQAIEDFMVKYRIPPSTPKYCIYDEDLNHIDGYWSLKAYSHREVRCVDQYQEYIPNRTIVDHCIVNVNISFWYQRNKSIRANLGLIEYISKKKIERSEHGREDLLSKVDY